MKLHYLQVTALLCLFYLGCSSQKEEEKSRLDANAVTLSVPPGTYEHGVVVVFKKADDGAGSGALEIQKPDGSWSFAFSECNGGIDTGSSCVTVNETRTIKYRLATISGESSEKEATYVINPKSNDLTINGSQFSESITDCYTSISEKKLYGRIKLANSQVLGTAQVAYVHFSVDYTSLNDPKTITNDSKNGVTVKGTGDNPPMSADNYPGASSNSSDKCVVSISSFMAGQRAAGELECSLNKGTFSSTTPLGATIQVSKGPWQCDQWKSVLTF